MAGFQPQIYNFTPAALAVTAIAVGGTAQIAITGPCNGGFIQNPYNSAAQGGVGPEPLYVSFGGTAPGTDAGANGVALALQQGQSIPIPALGPGQTISVNAATSGHKFTGVRW